MTKANLMPAFERLAEGKSEVICAAHQNDALEEGANRTDLVRFG
jgi:hypothetical protein